MAVTYDSTTLNTVENDTQVIVNHTVGAFQDNAIVVFVYPVLSTNVTSITYGGVDVPFVAKFDRIAAYVLANPPQGANDLIVDVDTALQLTASITSLYGVDQAEPYVSANNWFEYSWNKSDAISSVDNLSLACFTENGSDQDAAYNPTGDQTLVASQYGNFGWPSNWVGITTAPGADIVSLTAEGIALNTARSAGLDIKASTGAGGGTTTQNTDVDIQIEFGSNQGVKF